MKLYQEPVVPVFALGIRMNFSVGYNEVYKEELGKTRIKHLRWTTITGDKMAFTERFVQPIWNFRNIKNSLKFQIINMIIFLGDNRFFLNTNFDTKISILTAYFS